MNKLTFLTFLVLMSVSVLAQDTNIDVSFGDPNKQFADIEATMPCSCAPTTYKWAIESGEGKFVAGNKNPIIAGDQSSMTTTPEILEDGSCKTTAKVSSSLLDLVQVILVDESSNKLFSLITIDFTPEDQTFSFVDGDACAVASVQPTESTNLVYTLPVSQEAVTSLPPSKSTPTGYAVLEVESEQNSLPFIALIIAFASSFMMYSVFRKK